MRTVCPNCGASSVQPFYSVLDVPTNSCLLVGSRQEALAFPRGDIALSFCRRCGFIFNAAFRPEQTVYSELYEETQGYSPTFNIFHRELAEGLIRRHRLYDKDVVEIGCGKGEFLALLCELGGNRGTGFDPSFVPARLDTSCGDIHFIRDFFSETTEIAAPDLLCCKMTLEHIPETHRFVRAVRRSVSPERGTVVFFQIPDTRRILDDVAFWDIYYEHCSYFTRPSLAYLFCSNGFEILDLSTTYGGQYLTVEARPCTPEKAVEISNEELRERDALPQRVAQFASRVEATTAEWKTYLRRAAADGRRTVLWGSGSKAVAFLTTLGLRDEIDYVVDINPHRHGKFIPGAGQKIVAPAFLAEDQPDTVIAMNSIYLDEIAAEMARHGCRAPLLSIDRLPIANPVPA